MKHLQAKDGVLAVQHLPAMFGATVLVPLLTGFSPSVALFRAGLGTLLFPSRISSPRSRAWS